MISMSLKMVCSLAAVLGGLLAVGSAQGATPVKIMTLGDSITLGITPQANSNSSFPDPNNSSTTNYGIAGGYRTSLYNTLNTAGVSFTFVGSQSNNPSSILTSSGQTKHEGHGGYTIGAFYGDYSLQQHINTWMNAKPDVILLHIGTNDMLWSRDFYNGDPNNSAVPKMNPTTAKANLITLLDSIYAKKPDVKLFVSKIIPLTGDHAWVNSRVIEYNNNVADVVNTYKAQGKSIYLVDQYAAFTNANGSPNGSHLPDGIHPDQAGYNLMGTTFANAYLATVPEPTTIGSILLIGGAMAMRRRHVA